MATLAKGRETGPCGCAVTQTRLTTWLTLKQQQLRTTAMGTAEGNGT